MTFQGQWLDFHVLEGIVDVALHGEPANEIGTTALSELESLLDFVRDGAGGARAIVLRSTQRMGFSAGADLRELHAGLGALRGDPRASAERRARVSEFLDRIHGVMNSLDAAPIPTVAAVHGACFGGGFELALACDVIVADRSARFAFPELRLGLIPGFGGLPRLEREVGNAVVRDFLLTGRSIGAERCYQLGLVSQLVARGEAPRAARAVATQAGRFDARALRAAKAFTKSVPFARLEEEKRLFLDLLDSPTVDAALAKFVASKDARPYLP